MFSLTKKVMILIMSIPLISGYCLLLKNQERKVKKVIVDNDYMNFPYKIKIDKCIESCNDKDNPYFKVFLPDSIKNISVKSFDLLTKKSVLKNISFHQSCKCGCLLDEKVCNNLQKWNKEKCRYECLEIKDCDVGYSWNVSNCRCEMKKLAALVEEEECDVETIDKIENKTVTLIKKIANCKFVTSSILFVCVSIMLTGIMIYFCLKSRNNNVLPC